MMEQMLKLCMFLLRVKLTFLEDTVMLIVYKQCGFFFCFFRWALTQSRIKTY